MQPSPSPTQLDRRRLRDEIIFSDFTQVKLPAIPPVPGQISNGESRYLYWLISQAYMGLGAVVELGTWLGCSTVHLAAGLRDSGVGRKLHSYDLFVWGGDADNRKSGLELEKGADFMPWFLKNIEPLREWIEVQKGSFSRIDWSPEERVEILFLDGPKTEPVIRDSLRIFGPALIPGESMLVFQDYQHPPSYDIPLAVHRLGRKLQLRHAIESGGTVSFALQEPIEPEDVAPGQLGAAGWTVGQAREAWEQILGALQEGPVLERLRSACALHLCDLGEVEAALETLRGVTFNMRLHHGWKNWGRNPKFTARYQPLIELYQNELTED